VLFLDILVGACQHQKAIRHLGTGSPHLGTVENPTAIRLDGDSLHGAEHIGAAIGFGHAQGNPQLAFRHGGQPAALLLVSADLADGLGATE